MIVQLTRPTIKRWSKAVTQVDEYFSNFPTARRLSEVELERYIDRGFKGGWQLRVDEFVDGAQRTLNVLVDRDFPYQPPRVVCGEWPGIAFHGRILRKTVFCACCPLARPFPMMIR